MPKLPQQRYTVRTKAGALVGGSASFETAKALACAGKHRILYEKVQARIIKRGTYSEGKWVPTT